VLENKQLLNELLDHPEKFFDSLQRYANSLTTTLIYGRRGPQLKDPTMLEILRNNGEFINIIGSSQSALLDAYPVLRALPDWVVTSRARANRVYKDMAATFLRLYRNVKDEMQAGTAQACMCVDMASIQEKEGFSDIFAAYVAGTLVEAGIGTTSNTLYGFIQAMLLFPDVQKKAQEELDRVVGTERLPTMEDEPQLQYIRGCVKEALRWMPTTFNGAIPHAATQDDTYMGYTIPKGSLVVNNVYTINMDPYRFPDPRRFEPDRYQDDCLGAAESAAVADVSKRDHFTFGAGRRLCQGIHVAEQSLFIGISRILWGFNVSPVRAADGSPILPDSTDYVSGFAVHPVPYQAHIRPRSTERADIIRAEWKKAQEECLDPTTKQWKK
jgi:cytochrome P450